MDAFFEFWEFDPNNPDDLWTLIFYILAFIFFWIIGTKKFRDWEESKQGEEIIFWTTTIIKFAFLIFFLWLMYFTFIAN
mgnify:CR=1 FL=1